MEALTQQMQTLSSHMATLVKQQGKKVEEPEPINSARQQVNSNPIAHIQPVEDLGGIQVRSARLDFPRFNGEDPKSWIYRANQFFAYNQTNPLHRLVLASFHMEGKALSWYQDLEATGGITSWEGFLTSLQTRFGPSAFEDPMADLTRLKQTSTVEAYKSEFEVISNQLRGLAEPYKLSCLISGLREEIR